VWELLTSTGLYEEAEPKSQFGDLLKHVND
jgi:hypothetical protein